MEDRHGHALPSCATMPGNLSLVIGSFWLGCWGVPGYGDGGNGDP
jgi:hypothetical protein